MYELLTGWGGASRATLWNFTTYAVSKCAKSAYDLTCVSNNQELVISGCTILEQECRHLTIFYEQLMYLKIYLDLYGELIFTCNTQKRPMDTMERANTHHCEVSKQWLARWSSCICKDQYTTSLETCTEKINGDLMLVEEDDKEALCYKTDFIVQALLNFLPEV